MRSINLFSAIQPLDGFPSVTADINIARVTYDLVLPEDIIDMLLIHFIDDQKSYKQLDNYCNELGFRQVRKKPELLRTDLDERFPYAIMFDAAEAEPDKDDFAEFFSMRLAVGPQGTERLLERARTRTSIERELASYVVQHNAYFGRCSGFELLRCRQWTLSENNRRIFNLIPYEIAPKKGSPIKAKKKTTFREFLIT